MSDNGKPALFELFELTPRLHRLLDTEFKSLNPSLTFGQYRTLRRVGEGYNTLTAICQVGTLSLPALSERLDGLVRKRLVRRRANPRDRRSITLTLTPEGRRVLADGERLVAQISDRLLADLTETDAIDVVSAAHRLVQLVTSALTDRTDPAAES